MEINSDVRVPAYTTANEGVSEPTRPPRAALPAEGTVISGEITDLTMDSVSISTSEGQVTAALRGGPVEAKIGDNASFTVRYDSAGNPVLELNRMPKDMIRKADVSDALVAAGFKASPENISMALELLSKGLALTKENLLKMNQALKLLGSDKTQEALFMLKNDLKIGPRTAETIEKLLAGEAKLLGQLNSLEAKIAAVKDPGIREQLTKIFQNANSAEDALRVISAEVGKEPGDPAGLAGKIARAFRELAPEELGKFTEGLRQLADSGKENILSRPEFADALARETEKTKTSAPPAMKEEAGGQAPEKAAAGKVQENTAPAGTEKTVTPDISGKAPAVGTGNLSAKEIITELFKSKTDFFKLIDGSSDGFAQLREAVKNGTVNPDKPEDILKYLKIPIRPGELSPNELKYIADKLAGEAGDKNVRTGPAADKLRFDPRNTTPADIDKFLEGLRESLVSARGELLKLSSPEAANIMKEIADISKNIELTAQLRENLFIQLPVAINSHEMNAELFVFKDNKKRKKGGAATALIALDTVNLGRTETYIQKTGAAVNLQFRIKSEEVERTILQNLEKLKDGLEAHGLNLQVYSFKRLTEDFTPVREQSELLSEPAGSAGTEESGRDDRPVVFDVRL